MNSWVRRRPRRVRRSAARRGVHRSTHGGPWLIQPVWSAVSVPPLAFIGQLSLALEPVPAPAPTVRGAGRFCYASLAACCGSSAIWRVAMSLSAHCRRRHELTTGVPAVDRRALCGCRSAPCGERCARPFRWDVAQQQWLPLLSATDMEQQTASAGTLGFGTFQLQGPLRCADDASEPDDNDYAATVIVPGDEPALRLFDSPADEDWLRVDSGSRRVYIIDTTGAPAVDGA